MLRIADTALKNTAPDSAKHGKGSAPISQHRFVLEFDNTALQVAATSATAIDIGTDARGNSIPANAVIMDWSQDIRIAFVGGSISAVTLDFGDAVDPDELCDNADLFTAGGFLRTTRGTYTQVTPEATAYAPLAAVVAVGDDLDQLTAGRVEITIYYFAAQDPEA